MKIKRCRFVSSLKTYYPTSDITPGMVTGPVHLCAISIPRRSYSLAVVSAHWHYRTHCHLCPTRYSFSPESSEAFESEMPCPRTQHLNNVPTLKVEKYNISLKILHQAWFETARQAATSAERHGLTIAPYRPLWYERVYLESSWRLHHGIRYEIVVHLRLVRGNTAFINWINSEPLCEHLIYQ